MKQAYGLLNVRITLVKSATAPPARRSETTELLREVGMLTAIGKNNY